MTKITTFRKELENLINKHSMENNSNTPDFILAEYLVGCLDVFDKATMSREKWYGKNLKINQKEEQLTLFTNVVL